MGFVMAKLIPEKGEEITCQFNPTEFDVSNSAKYAERTIPGGRGTISQFVSGESPTLTVSLLFDTYIAPTVDKQKESGTDVSILTRSVVALTHVEGSLHRPPIVTFQWGKLKFRGIVTDVKQKFTMFLPSGVPVRATLDVTFKASSDSDSLSRQSPLESPDRTKYRIFKEGEYLWNYANEEYGSPGMWREIAKANGIMDPLNVRPGQVLKLPAL